MTDNAASALCYVLGLITGILFLVLAPYNQNKAIRFHAFQSIFLNIAWILVWIVLSIVFRALLLISVWLFAASSFLSLLIWLAFFVLWLYMIISAYQGKTVVLPVIGSIAQGQA